MTKRHYDNRSRDEILAGDRLAPFRTAPAVDHLRLGHLRTLDRFIAFAEAQGIVTPTVDDFLAFCEGDRSTRKLKVLQRAFNELLPVTAPARQTVSEAIRRKLPRKSRKDWRTREELRSDPLFEPYRQLPSFETIPVEYLRALSRFLSFMRIHGVKKPSVDHYLTYAKDAQSVRSLDQLAKAFDALLPGNPSSIGPLREAITQKRSATRTPKARGPGRPARRRLAVTELPADWQRCLKSLRIRSEPVAKSMEDMLREYAFVQRQAGLPLAITVDGVRRFEAFRTAQAAAKENPQYEGQGDRPATRHIYAKRIREFVELLHLDPLLIAALRQHERRLNRELASVVPLKFGRLDDLPGLAETWGLAVRLLLEGEQAKRRGTKLRLLNEAAVIALWTLMPLRRGDGQLRWGRDVWFDGERYRIDIVTKKEGEPLQGRLHEALTSFLDALTLRGVDRAYLREMRAQAEAEELPLFRHHTGRQFKETYFYGVWKKHMGTGAHISRTRVHSELGKLGPEGVRSALALCAQRDPRTAAAYQSEAVSRALREKGQDMIDALLTEAAALEDGKHRLSVPSVDVAENEDCYEW